jgi:hypothetical protein
MECSFVEIPHIANIDCCRPAEFGTPLTAEYSYRVYVLIMGTDVRKGCGRRVSFPHVRTAFYASAFLPSASTHTHARTEAYTTNDKQTPWSESASELYRPSDRRLSAKWLTIFADKGCHVVSVTDPYGRILGFLDRSHYIYIKQTKLNSVAWVRERTIPTEIIYKAVNELGKSNVGRGV